MALDKPTTVLSITTSYAKQASGVHSMWYSQHKIQSTLKSPGLLDVDDIAASTVWIQTRYGECGQRDRESGEERRECVDSKKKCSWAREDLEDSFRKERRCVGEEDGEIQKLLETC